MVHTEPIGLIWLYIRGKGVELSFEN